MEFINQILSGLSIDGVYHSATDSDFSKKFSDINTKIKIFKANVIAGFTMNVLLVVFAFSLNQLKDDFFLKITFLCMILLILFYDGLLLYSKIFKQKYRYYIKLNTDMKKKYATEGDFDELDLISSIKFMDGKESYIGQLSKVGNNKEVNIVVDVDKLKDVPIRVERVVKEKNKSKVKNFFKHRLVVLLLGVILGAALIKLFPIFITFFSSK